MATKAQFEVFPEISREAPTMGAPTGEFVWHFQAANGDITFGGEESYTRREDAHRGIRDSVFDVTVLMCGGIEEACGPNLRECVETIRIVDLDADGKQIAEE